MQKNECMYVKQEIRRLCGLQLYTHCAAKFFNKKVNEMYYHITNKYTNPISSRKWNENFLRHVFIFSAIKFASNVRAYTQNLSSISIGLT